MKKILLISISSLILCCNPKKDKPYIYPNESMTQLLDSFIQETPNKNRINQIYIDKINPYNYHILLYSGNTDINNGQCKIPALYKIRYADRIFDVFSGVEEFFSDSINQPKTVMEKMKSFKKDSANIWWFVEDYNGRIYINEENNATPFGKKPLHPVDSSGFYLDGQAMKRHLLFCDTMEAYHRWLVKNIDILLKNKE